MDCSLYMAPASVTDSVPKGVTFKPIFDNTLIAKVRHDQKQGQLKQNKHNCGEQLQCAFLDIEHLFHTGNKE